MALHRSFRGCSKLCLKTGLEDVGAAAVHRRRCSTILNVGTNVVKHQTGVSREIPVQACGEIGLFPSPDGLIVQVYKGDPSPNLQGPPSPLSGTKVLLWLKSEKRP